MQEIDLLLLEDAMRGGETEISSRARQFQIAGLFLFGKCVLFVLVHGLRQEKPRISAMLETGMGSQPRSP